MIDTVIDNGIVLLADNCEQDLGGEIESLPARPSGWLIYNTHGLDVEGWGPIRPSYLDQPKGLRGVRRGVLNRAGPSSAGLDTRG